MFYSNNKYCNKRKKTVNNDGPYKKCTQSSPNLPSETGVYPTTYLI